MRVKAQIIIIIILIIGGMSIYAEGNYAHAEGDVPSMGGTFEVMNVFHIPKHGGFGRSCYDIALRDIETNKEYVISSYKLSALLSKGDIIYIKFKKKWAIWEIIEFKRIINERGAGIKNES